MATNTSIPLQDTIAAKETALENAMRQSDVSALETLLADDLIFTGPDGKTYSKADDIAIHRAGRQKLHHIERRDIAIKAEGDVGIVTCEAWLQGSFDAQPIEGRFRYTRIWLKRGENWQAVAAHCSMVAES